MEDTLFVHMQAFKGLTMKTQHYMQSKSMTNTTAHSHPSFRSFVKFSRVLNFLQSKGTHFLCYEFLFCDRRWCHKSGKSVQDSLVFVAPMGETPNQDKDYLRHLLWYMGMPDTKLNFAKGYTRWTKFSCRSLWSLKESINSTQSMLQHSLRHVDWQMWSLYILYWDLPQEVPNLF